jgi:hypothetical protein
VADDAGSHDDSVLAIEALGLVDTLLEALWERSPVFVASRWAGRSQGLLSIVMDLVLGSSIATEPLPLLTLAFGFSEKTKRQHV